MLEVARVFAGLGALMLLASGVFWIKSEPGHQMDHGEIFLSSGIEWGSRLLVLSMALSAVAASLAVIGMIAV